ncbi:hypothetical protein [Streptomyces sp. NPDC056255]|uniref:hypothetical protein n=1 Tax=Streptomyces sp. NPDC056255 TaxID=3345764 RepID=UPI0035D8F67F
MNGDAAGRDVEHRDAVAHDIKRSKNRGENPSQPNPPPVTHKGEVPQLGWILGRLAGICTPPNPRHATALARTAILNEGLTNEEEAPS